MDREGEVSITGQVLSHAERENAEFDAAVEEIKAEFERATETPLTAREAFIAKLVLKMAVGWPARAWERSAGGG